MNTFLRFTYWALGCLLLTSTLAIAQAPANGLVAYYPFNGNANDESGNGNHGTVQGSGVNQTTDRLGTTNAAYEFNGTPFSHIVVPDNSSLCSNSFTLSAWVSFPSDGGGYVINKGRDIFDGSYRLHSNSVGAQVNYFGTNGTSTYPTPSNQWVMVTGIVTNNIAKYYVNGTKVSEATLTWNFICYSGGQPLTIGSHYYNGVPDFWAYPYKGKIDDVRIYNRALSDAEVAALYSSGTSTIQLTTALRFGGGYSTLHVGTGYNLSGTLKNNGNGPWTGDIYLKVNNGNPTLLAANQTIAAGERLNLSENFLPQTAQIGQNIPIELLTKQGSGDFVTVATVNSTTNPVRVNIEAASNEPVVRVPFIRLNQSEVSPGGIIQIVGGNFEPGTLVSLSSTPTIEGAIYPVQTVATDGSINISFTVPSNYPDKFLTLVALDLKRNNPSASIIIRQAPEVATLRIDSPNKENANIEIAPRGEVALEFSDKLLKGAAYSQSGASRSYRYEVGYRDPNNSDPNAFTLLYQMPVSSGLLNSELRQTIRVPMSTSDFWTVSVGEGFPIQFIIRDMYDPQRKAESPKVYIKIVEGISKVSFKWDKSFAPTPINDPIGIAADGVARMYLVVEKSNPAVGSVIQSVNLTLANYESNSDPTNFNNGTWLGRVKYANQQNNNQYSEEANDITTITAQNISTNTDGKYWFWYVAPDDFTRDGLPQGQGYYDNESDRYVSAKFTVTYADGSIEQLTKDIQIVRPPLMLVHGLNSDAGAWDKFGLKNSGLFKYYRASNMMPDVTYLENALGLVNQQPNKINYEDTFQGITDKMRSLGWACSQVDYVAHSMGGLMLRSLVENFQKKYYAGETTPNLSHNNYQKGFVHKLITINTPHNGSPIADVVTGLSPYLAFKWRALLSYDIYARTNWANNFVKPSNESLVRPFYDPVYQFVASPAVVNLQTSPELGGIRFNNTPLRAHLIASDIATGTTKPSAFKVLPYVGGALRLYQLINGASSAIKGLGTLVLAPLPASAIVSTAIVAENALDASKLTSLPNRFYISQKTNFDLIWGNTFDFTSKSDEAVQKTLDLYGTWNDKYADFSYNSDLVVPLLSQTAGIMSGDQITVLQDISLPSGISRFNHVFVTDQPETSSRVKYLLNKEVGGSFFGPIPKNNTGPLGGGGGGSWLATPLKPKKSTSFSGLNDLVYEKLDTTKIKITKPTINQTFQSTQVINIHIENRGDTLGLKSVSLVFGENWQSDSLKSLKSTFSFPTPNSTGLVMIIATAEYEKNDTTFMFYDTLAVKVISGEVLQNFDASPSTKNLALETPFFPDYTLQYSSYISKKADFTKLNVSISSPACLTYNTQTGQFRGEQKGEAVVIFTYDGIFKDTMYVAVGGGGDPYPQQISTNDVPRSGDSTICSGATILVPFTTSGGAFEEGNQFFVQLSDASGENFTTLETTGTTSPLSARIPNGLSDADTYKVRVVSISPPVLGTSAPLPLKIRNHDTDPIVSLLSGSWDNPTTWSCGRIPSVLDTVIVNPGHTITLPANYTVTVQSVDLQGKIEYGANAKIQLGQQ